MIRRRVAILLAVAAITPACSATPEQTIIGDFFAASRLRDLTALSRFATVVFEPRQRGMITEFTIRSVSTGQAPDGSALKDVVIDAPVRTSGGGTIATVLVVRLQRRRDDNSQTAAPDLYRGWIVTGVTEAPAVPAVPPS